MAWSDMANGASFHWSRVIETLVGVTAVTAGGTTSAVTLRVVIAEGTATLTVEPCRAAGPILSTDPDLVQDVMYVVIGVLQ